MNTTPADLANPYAPPQVEVRDATGSDAAGLPAGRAERLVAAIIDAVTFLFAGSPLLIGMDWEAFMVGANPFPFNATAWTLAGIAYLVLIAITIRLVHENGQTIGKKVLGIKVVRSDGSRASLGRIFWLRNLVNGIPGAIPYFGNVYAFVDHLFIFGGRRQCLHDRIADTIVVKA